MEAEPTPPPISSAPPIVSVAPPVLAEPLPVTPPPLAPPPKSGGGAKKAFAPLAAIGALLAKFKLLLPALKLLPFLKTGGTMILSIAIYTWRFGFWFAVGVVMLIFVHECGHLIAAKKLGLKVGAPMFIPFFGAVILLKETPRNAWIEAQVGIGGPLLGAAGAAVCYLIYMMTGSAFFCALAWWGFYINLWNLTPIGFLDGGRIVSALSPWMWLIGVVVFGTLMVLRPSPMLILVFIMSLPRLISLFRRKTPEQLRYYEVTPRQRVIIAGLYFGLIALLVVGIYQANSDLNIMTNQVAQLIFSGKTGS